MRIGSLCASVSALLFTSFTAAAAAPMSTVPPGCRDGTVTNPGRAARAYVAGMDSGKKLVTRAWSQVNDCDALEDFADIVVENIQSYSVSSRTAYVICRYTGLVDGAFEQLDRVWTTCDDQCCLEGEVIGQLSAELYCELSIILGGLLDPDDFVRGPVTTCGLEFQTCCDSTFIGTSRNYVGYDLSGRATACLQYTQGSYQSVWTETRNLECAYEPPPPPPPPENP
jgi:hypothetical protein